MKKNLKKISQTKVKLFKIANRRGYAAVGLNNLTEGATSAQAYQRMIKAFRRKGYELPVIAADKIQKLVKTNI